MKRFLVFGFSLSVLTGVSVAHEVKETKSWQGEGWYQVVVSSGDGYGGYDIHKEHPYETKKLCNEELPADEYDGDLRTIYECFYLEDRSELSIAVSGNAIMLGRERGTGD